MILSATYFPRLTSRNVDFASKTKIRQLNAFRTLDRLSCSRISWFLRDLSIILLFKSAKLVLASFRKDGIVVISNYSRATWQKKRTVRSDRYGNLDVVAVFVQCKIAGEKTVEVTGRRRNWMRGAFLPNAIRRAKTYACIVQHIVHKSIKLLIFIYSMIFHGELFILLINRAPNCQEKGQQWSAPMDRPISDLTTSRQKKREQPQAF